MRTFGVSLVVAAGLALAACGGGGESAEQEPAAGSEGTAGSEDTAGSQALPPAPTVTGAEARQLVADGALLLDVTPNERADQSLIEGRTHIPLPELASRMSELPRDRVIVVYCFGGRGSPVAGARLQAEGFDVRVMGARAHWDE
ncbi:MAG: hypothetical protein KC619_14620 [Myxococcales bacterium]|nr:hypothetical protein [Myxococcales bacterium]